MAKRCCVACARLFEPRRHVPHQRYCSRPECQRARRRCWQREKLATDADYRASTQAQQLLHIAKQNSRSPHLHDWIQLALCTGFRRGEIINLRYDQWDPIERRVTFLPHQHKSRTLAVLPDPAIAFAILERRKAWATRNGVQSDFVFADRDGALWGTPRTAFRSAVRKSGIGNQYGFHIHDLRHTYAQWMVAEGVDPVRLQFLLRHQSIVTTEIYYQVTPDLAAPEVEKIDRLFASSKLVGARGIEPLTSAV